MDVLELMKGVHFAAASSLYTVGLSSRRRSILYD
jgi:hypothetical protein